MSSLLSYLSLWIHTSRFQFFTAVLAPALVGGGMAWWEQGEFEWGLWFLTLLGLVLLHAAANLANDYYDHLSGNDALNRSFVSPFTGGSRAIQQGRVAPRAVLAAALASLAGGAAIGLYLTWLAGWPVLVLGIFGGATGVFYTAPPLKLGYRGWGELFIALDFGLLPTVGIYYVLTGTVTGGALAASLPVALLISAVLWINQFQDYTADKAVKKRHGVVRLGRKASRWIHLMLVTSPFLVLEVLVLLRLLPPLSLLALLALPLMSRAINVAMREYNRPYALVPANAATIALHLLFAVLLTVGLGVDRYLLG